MSGPHSSHLTRFSDASSFDEICVKCGATDEIGGWGQLANPCSVSDEEYEKTKHEQRPVDQIDRK